MTLALRHHQRDQRILLCSAGLRAALGRATPCEKSWLLEHCGRSFFPIGGRLFRRTQAAVPETAETPFPPGVWPLSGVAKVCASCDRHSSGLENSGRSLFDRYVGE